MSRDDGTFGGGRSLAEPAFPDDDGLIDQTLQLADEASFLATIGSARVFVPVVAVLGELALTTALAMTRGAEPSDSKVPQRFVERESTAAYRGH